MRLCDSDGCCRLPGARAAGWGQFLHISSRNVGEFAQVIPGQRSGGDMFELTEVAGRYVQEGVVRPGIGVVWILDDEVEEDEERGQGHDSKNTV